MAAAPYGAQAKPAERAPAIEAKTLDTRGHCK
jgi:hypothetical protein